jgi:hypothetical protein
MSHRASPADRTKIREALRHKNVLGAGAEKRRGLPKEDVMPAVMAEWKRGTLHSGSGKIVKKHSQAIAIGMSETKRH